MDTRPAWVTQSKYHFDIRNPLVLLVFIRVHSWPNVFLTSLSADCAPSFMHARSLTQKNRSIPASIQNRASLAGAAAAACFPYAFAEPMTRAAVSRTSGWLVWPATP